LEPFEHRGLGAILLELLLVEHQLILLVTELLECVVEHDLGHLVVRGDREHCYVALAEVMTFGEVLLVQDQDLAAIPRLSQIDYQVL